MYRYTEEKPHLCIYSRSSGFGHTVYGKYKLQSCYNLLLHHYDVEYRWRSNDVVTILNIP